MNLLNILVTNDDGYKAKGLQALVKAMRPFGKLTVIVPKYPQSGTSMAVTMGLRPIAVKKISNDDSEPWYYVDGTPASCVKYGIDEVFTDKKPDLIVSGINHGGNFATASAYSGTIGAAMEGAVADIPSIGVSLDDMSRDADFTAAEKLLPEVIRRILLHDDCKTGVYYNVNFPALPENEIKGIRLGHEGMMHWEKEFEPYDYDIFAKKGTTPQDMGITAMPEPEPGETIYIMKGFVVDDKRNTSGADHRLVKEGYVSVTVHNLYTTDFEELERLRGAGFEADFKH